ncbi:hypothetical protein [Halomonas sp. PR-M31]|uniref:hypothetical protein n=1 Tax=Halomonas sp. PR-M31 TaxID=1471202 RepID=UPI000A9F1D30|nr:hypothetical protein [Halomonas sp. PR-M31]
MPGEPLRSQYLEAMGLTAWVSRYRLPNAAPTTQCEWLEPEAPPSQPPAQRLQALLGKAAHEERALENDQDRSASSTASSLSNPSSPSVATPSRQARRARALLDDNGIDGDEDKGNDDSDSSRAPQTRVAKVGSEASDLAPDTSTVSPQASLRFSLQIAALDGRWLVMLPGRELTDSLARGLLANLLQAAHIAPGTALDFQAFDWPMMEGLPVEAPLEEAKDGLRAFVEGRRRRGWRPERLLLFGEDATLDSVLSLQEHHCHLLDIPGWQGPSLQTLAQSAQAKREIWPLLNEWRKAWHQAAQGKTDDDEAAH